MATTKENPRRKRIREVINHPYVRAFLDTIAAAEIGDASINGAGYDVAFGHNKKFSDFSAHPGTKGAYNDLKGKRRTSTAAGRYQFLQGTYNDLVKRYGFTDFTPRTQDEMAIALAMDVRALDDILRGDINSALPKLGKRWASLHTSEAGRQLHGTRPSSFIYDAWNKAVARHKAGAGTPAPTADTPQAIPTPPLPTPTTPPVLPSGRVSAAGPTAVRDLLQQRYTARRPLVLSPKQLTPDVAADLMKTLFVGETPPIQPGPSEHAAHTPGPTLIQQLPVDRTAQAVRSVDVTPSTPQAPAAPVDVWEGDPAFPLQPPTSEPPGPQPTFIVSELADGLLQMVTPPVVATSPPMDQVTYIDDQLKQLHSDGDFLGVSMLDMPRSRELLQLIDSTKVQPIG